MFRTATVHGTDNGQRKIRTSNFVNQALFMWYGVHQGSCDLARGLEMSFKYAPLVELGQ